MTFEEVLPKIKQGKKAIRSGWGGAEEYIEMIPERELDGQHINPFFVIQVVGEGLTMFQPTVCDILATDWEIVE